MEVQLYMSPVIPVMSSMEYKALLTFKDDVVGTIDPIHVAYELVSNGHISVDLFQKIRAKSITEIPREEISEVLVNNLPYHTNLISVIKVLDKCGYHQLSSKLFLRFIKDNTNFQELQKSPKADRKGLHAFFRNLKIMIHDAQFKDPREALRNLAKSFMKQFEEEEDELKKQRLADKVVAILGAEIDAHAITFDSGLPNNETFDEMKSLVPYTENTLITDVVYYGRLANANAIALKFDDGEDMLREARTRAFNTGPCLELVNMLYIEVYFLLWRYEQTPTNEIRDSLLMWGRIGLESLEAEEYGTKLMWRRMFILRMVFCLLGIGNRANIIVGADVDANCVNMAEGLLAEFDRFYEKIEQRRQMFYFVAKARLFQFRGDLTMAELFVQKAEQLAISGNFREVEFIQEFKEVIEVSFHGATDSTLSWQPSHNSLGDDPYPENIIEDSRSEPNEEHEQMHSVHAFSSTTFSSPGNYTLPSESESEETRLKEPAQPEDETEVKCVFSETEETFVKQTLTSEEENVR